MPAQTYPWLVKGADAKTGESVSRIFDARSGREAERAAAGAGILISSVEPVHEQAAQLAPVKSVPSTLNDQDWKRLERTIVRGVAVGIWRVVIVYTLALILGWLVIMVITKQ